MASAVYTGAGAFVHGIPARDLTAAEWAALTDAQRAFATASGLYQAVEAVLPLPAPPDAATPAVSPVKESDHGR